MEHLQYEHSRIASGFSQASNSQLTLESERGSFCMYLHCEQARNPDSPLEQMIMRME